MTSAASSGPPAGVPILSSSVLGTVAVAPLVSERLAGDRGPLVGFHADPPSQKGYPLQLESKSLLLTRDSLEGDAAPRGHHAMPR
jgi:hypothetical protein